MKNAIYPGDSSLPLPAPYAVSSGGAALIGDIVAIALVDLASGAIGTFMLDGTYHSLPKSTGAGTGAAIGKKAYWDNAVKKFTAVSTNNTLAGVFFETVADAGTTCKIRFNGTAS